MTRNFSNFNVKETTLKPRLVSRLMLTPTYSER